MNSTVRQRNWRSEVLKLRVASRAVPRSLNKVSDAGATAARSGVLVRTITPTRTATIWLSRIFESSVPFSSVAASQGATAGSRQLSMMLSLVVSTP